MVIENIKEKTIWGFVTRTTNKDEMNPATSKIASLWQKFDDNVDVDYKNGNRVYGVYFNYESDANGEFTVLASTDQVEVHSDEPLESITIESGKYLTFHATGEIPEIVIETWGKVWQYFSKDDAKYKRTYKTDFEHYLNQNEIKVYIAIE